MSAWQSRHQCFMHVYIIHVAVGSAQYSVCLDLMVLRLLFANHKIHCCSIVGFHSGGTGSLATRYIGVPRHMVNVLLVYQVGNAGSALSQSWLRDLSLANNSQICLSQSGACVIDVTANPLLFQTFLTECLEQNSISLATGHWPLLLSHTSRQ